MSQCANQIRLNEFKFTTQQKTIIRFGLIAFFFKSFNVFNLSVATKNLTKNYTFFVVHGAGTYQVETSSIICRANQLSG